VGRFQKGVSGNPAGRPHGSRHSATMAAEALLDGEAESLTRKAIEMALGGDTIALRLCLERIYPPRKDRPVSFRLRSITSARDAADTMSDIMNAVSSGQITPSDAGELSKVIGGCVKAFEAAELSERLERAISPRHLTDEQLMRLAAGEEPSDVLHLPRLTFKSD
jgi:uncharacterized protein DUF5681